MVDFMLFGFGDGKMDEQMGEQMDICTSKVTFATENIRKGIKKFDFCEKLHLAHFDKILVRPCTLH